MKYILLFISSFIFTSLIDVVWHILLFGSIYQQRIKQVAPMVDGQLAIKSVPGLLSQVLVVSMLMVLINYQRPELRLMDGLVVGAAAGVLAITVYGLVNYALIKNWTLDITILEVVWGPILGGLSGLFMVWAKNLIFS